MVTAFFVYILLRDINQVVAILACILTTVVGSLRFVSMTPLIEQYLLPIAIASICFYSIFLKTRKKQYAVLTGLFLGASFVIKQQGVLFAGLMLLIIFLIHLCNSINAQKKLGLKVFTIILIVFTISIIGPLSEQIERNGTIDFVPANSVVIPFLYPKYFVNQEAVKRLIDWLSPSYWVAYESPFQAFKTYLLYPLFYTKAPSTFDMNWFIVFFVLSLLGMIFITKKNKPLGLILFSLLLLEVFTLYLTNTPIQNYHVIGIASLSIILSSGIYYFCKLIPYKKTLIPLISVLLITSLIFSYVSHIHQPVFGHSGRIDDKHVRSLNNLSEFIEANVPANAILLGADGVYRYWIERDFFWMSDMGGLDIYTLLSTRSEEEALKILEEHNIEYIFVDYDQVKRKGFGDYIPPDGLLTILDKSNYFEKVYDDNILGLYEVKYPISIENNNGGN